MKIINLELKEGEILVRLSKTWNRLLDHVYNQLYSSKTTGDVDREDLQQIYQTVQNTYRIFNGLLMKYSLHGDQVILNEQIKFIRKSFEIMKDYNTKYEDNIIQLMNYYNDKIVKLRFSFNKKI